MKIYRLILINFAFITSLNAYEAKLNFTPPKYVEEMQSKEFVEEFSKAGSLFGSGERPLFADRRAMKPNDLITILIEDSASSSYATSKKYAGSNSGSVQPPQMQYNGKDENSTKATNFLNDRINYNYKEGQRSTNFSGGGSQSKDQNFTATITARIIKVLENGNYYVYGSKETLIDGELVSVKVSGVIRPYDITSDNTIESRFIDNSKIEYSSIGNLSNTNKQKQTTDAMNSLWPF